MLIENLHLSTILNLTRTMKKPTENLLKLMKLIKHFLTELIDQLMMMSLLNKLFQEELSTFLKISFKTDGWTCLQKLTSCSLFLVEKDLCWGWQVKEMEETERTYQCWEWEWIWRIWWAKNFRTLRKDKATTNKENSKRKTEKRIEPHKSWRKK